MLRILAPVLLVGLLASVSLAAEVTYPLNGENTKITFVGSKPEGKHDGGFKKLTGTAKVDGTDVTTLKVAVDIDMNSLYSDNPKLTAHLKSPDFFGVKTYPKSRFVMTKVEKSGGEYKVTGRLTMHGKTKEVSFPATVEVKGESLSLSSNFTINRHDWGVSFGKGKVDDEVKMAISLRAGK